MNAEGIKIRGTTRGQTQAVCSLLAADGADLQAREDGQQHLGLDLNNVLL